MAGGDRDLDEDLTLCCWGVSFLFWSWKHRIYKVANLHVVRSESLQSSAQAINQPVAIHWWQLVKQMTSRLSAHINTYRIDTDTDVVNDYAK